MAENKVNYYTPKISEFYIGFEFEWKGFYKSQYTNCAVEWDACILTPSFEFDIIERAIEHKLVRVKYLDKQDIEKEGWKDLHNYPQLLEHHYQKGQFRLIHNVMENSIKIFIEPKTLTIGGEKYIYDGKCPSINELRKICQFLEIK